MTTALVLGKFLPPHAGHAFLVETARQLADEVVVCLLAHSAEPIPVEVRHAWLEELLPWATIRSGVATTRSTTKTRPCTTSGRRRSRRSPADSVDVLLTSEPAYGDMTAERIGARHLLVDPDRKIVPVSATVDPGRPVRELGVPRAMRPRLVREARVAPRRRVDGHDDADRATRPGASTRSRTPSTGGSTAPRRTPAASPGHPPSSCTSRASSRRSRTRPRASRTGSCSATRTCSRPRSGTSSTWAIDRRGRGARVEPSVRPHVPDGRRHPLGGRRDAQLRRATPAHAAALRGGARAASRAGHRGARVGRGADPLRPSSRSSASSGFGRLSRRCWPRGLRRRGRRSRDRDRVALPGPDACAPRRSRSASMVHRDLLERRNRVRRPAPNGDRHLLRRRRRGVQSDSRLGGSRALSQRSSLIRLDVWRQGHHESSNRFHAREPRHHQGHARPRTADSPGRLR